MIRLIASLLTFLALATTAAAQQGVGTIIDNDVYAAGQSPRLMNDGMADAYMTGGTVTISTDVSGSVHTAARRVEVSGNVGGNLYAMGMDVRVRGAVAGDASVLGYDVRLGEIAGDLRVGGATIVLTGPIGGYAVVGGEEVEIEGPIAGDLYLAVEDIDWGNEARIEGQLILFEEEPGRLDIPEWVVPEDRIDRRDAGEWEDMTDHAPRPGFGRMLGGFLSGVLVVALLAAAIAALMPEALAAMRRRILDAPARTLWMGFLAQSALIGSGILFGMTIIGLFFTPAAVLLSVFVAFAGYIIGAYAFGVWLIMAIGRGEPGDIADRAVAALIGAALAGLIALIPFLGWLFVMALVLLGVGAITIRLFAPRFMTH